MEEPGAVSSFIKRLFTPQFVGSYKSPLTEELLPLIYIFRSEGAEPEVLEIKNLYPFMTLQDLKTIIYLEKKQAPEFYPTLQALMIPYPIGDVETTSLQNTYGFVDFAWIKPGTTTEFNMRNPFSRAQARDVDERFVDQRGGAKVNDPAQRDPKTIALRDAGKLLKGETDKWVTSLIPLGDGLLLATKL